jgi:hypothetical protein
MMEVKTKFSVREKVYFCDDFDILELQINKISIDIFVDGVIQIDYLNFDDDILTENELFSTKDEAKDFLIQKIKGM